jgi:thiol-disulfide isomerase/thioredoxin
MKGLIPSLEGIFLLAVVGLGRQMHHECAAFSPPLVQVRPDHRCSTTTAFGSKEIVTTTTLYYKTEGSPETSSSKSERAKETAIVKGLDRKPIITELTSLDDLKYLLEEEEDNNRFVAIQFYSQTCKSCQKLKPKYKQFAQHYGDGIVARQKVMGRIHCAQIALTPATKSFVQQQLQVDRFPTIQLYYKQYKVMDISGATNTKLVEARLQELWSLSSSSASPTQALEERAQELDDGVLSDLLEDHFFDQPEFLNEEW